MRRLWITGLLVLFAYPVEAGMWRVPPGDHAYLDAADSSHTLDLVLNTWATIENSEGTFYNELELAKFTTLRNL